MSYSAPRKANGAEKRSCTNAGDEIKLRTVAASAPAVQKSCTESSIVTATGYGEKIRGRQFAVVGSEGSFVGLEAKGRHTMNQRPGLNSHER